jgi:hypothetical protein
MISICSVDDKLSAGMLACERTHPRLFHLDQLAPYPLESLMQLFILLASRVSTSTISHRLILILTSYYFHYLTNILDDPDRWRALRQWRESLPAQLMAKSSTPRHGWFAELPYLREHRRVLILNRHPRLPKQS